MKKKAVPAFIAIVMAFAVLAGAQENAPAPSQPQTQGPGMGQGRRHGGMKGDPVARRMQMMQQRFNLSDDQKARIQPIVQNEVQQAQAIRNDAALTPEQKKAKFEELRNSTRSQIEPLLTPEQRAQMGRGGQGQGDPQRRLEMLSKQLNLTEDQKAKLTPVFQAQMQQMQALRQDASLSAEQKKAKMQQIREDTHKQVLGVLTPEQQQQLREMRGRHGGRGGRFGQPPAQGTAPNANPGM
jgi:Spy/CpxP family protein refolding chaperone